MTTASPPNPVPPAPLQEPPRRSWHGAALGWTLRLLRNLRVAARGVPRGGGGPSDPRVRRASRSIAEVYIVMAVALAGWIVYLSVALPQRNLNHHYDLTWIGFDCLLLAAMAATAYHAAKINARVTLAANATATLLIVDAWMDITSSSSTSALLTAIAFAALLEFPVAAMSLRIARGVTRDLAARAEAAPRPKIEQGSAP